MTTIIYLEDNGERQVLKQIADIARLGISGDQDAKELAKYIRQGLQLLGKFGVPSDKRLMMVSEEVDGDKRTFHLLKELKHIPYPLFEFRINRTTPGAFRAIFFEYKYEEEQLLIFAKSVLKQGDPNPPELQQAIKESLALYERFHENPELYLGEDD
ncbi:hypothetical protein SAMN05880501_1133 [Ureibacillus xyleni]|uniref:Uncharacterized protein n=1 Tax=Ureibacillus xyleni TaxID=614648 RepID=A0A285THI9_9BACL|nr:hypothetical protein [Ureibacillus xyleni]SOC21512.1 hypothetical protein SAMN05880501_1133 [Ureibacillus xyleni]